ncbi:aminodeoxychorismate synthase component I [Nakamurella flava]|uniref:Aminodeoxychorismate synthase component I n=1 Tax=Nakamurella flava TaxID=2576308 RepID=A0A4U6QAE8_9ACTN|nr:aminodeoxychorismate synthase component I [Nakamurella flava]TKV56862.1 aminodeoxychorismate synthase component I [Nakamurella flava]
MPWARFDDLRSGTALEFGAPHRELIAEQPSEVVGVLQQVQHATDAGQWAYGHVGYEAASAFGAELVTHDRAPGDPPLAWFGVADAPRPVPVVGAPDAEPTDRWWPEWIEPEYAEQVERVRGHIARGESYQGNLTVRMAGHVPGDPLEVYRRLAHAQSGAHNAYLEVAGFAVASASPELFFERHGPWIRVRPMKGTARRSPDPVEDARRAAALRVDPKERAENTMIVDLMRNDLGRIARTGSVRVPTLLRVERYPTVLQMTSDVTADLRADVGLPELFTALFPCGSITGAPKASSMRIIRDVETGPRGIYCGAIGVVGPAKDGAFARFSVAIRTAVVDLTTRRAHYGVGSGVTWLSSAPSEHAEVLIKTAVLGRPSDPRRLSPTPSRRPTGEPGHRHRKDDLCPSTTTPC